MDFKPFIRDVPDFPKPGIVFKDITPLFGNTEALQKASEALYKMTKNLQVDKVVGIESRGFILAPQLALKLSAGFVPVRKKGKLPFTTKAIAYGLEYGSDVLEIHTDAIMPGERVLVHDDVLATGGTAAAVCDLVEQLGGVVVQCNFLIELGFLEGKQKLGNRPSAALITY